jgi:hypothetical protein
MHETMPYMRAIERLADRLSAKKEILELNPNNNQGIVALF